MRSSTSRSPASTSTSIDEPTDEEYAADSDDAGDPDVED
jgi:hypothetical protein